MEKKKCYRRPETDYAGCALRREPAEINTEFEEMFDNLF